MYQRIRIMYKSVMKFTSNRLLITRTIFDVALRAYRGTKFRDALGMYY